MSTVKSSVINVRTKNARAFSEDAAVMHLLPVEFRDYNGPARVSNFFIVKEIKEEVKVEEDKKEKDDDQKSETKKEESKKEEEKKEPLIYYQSMFRGREFFGQNLKLPEQYFGVVFREKEDDEEEGQRYWDVYKYFRDFNYWNREEVPSERDHVQKWMEWPGISKIVNKPVDKEQMEKMKAKLEAAKEEEEKKKAEEAEEAENEEEGSKMEETSSPEEEEKEEEEEEVEDKKKRKRSSPKKEEKTVSPTQKKNKKL